MRHWQIKSRIFGAFLLIILIFTIGSYLMIRFNLSMSETLVKIDKEYLTTTLDLVEFGRAVDQIQMILFQTGASGMEQGVGGSYSDQVDAWFARGMERLDAVESRLLSLSTDIKEVDHASSLESTSDHIEHTLEEVSTLKSEFENFKNRGLVMAQAYLRSGSAIGNMFMGQASEDNTRFGELIQEIIDENQDDLNDGISFMESSIVLSVRLTVLILSVSLILVVLFGILISRSISIPINDVVALTRDMSEGDLTKRIERVGGDSSRSEIHQLSRDFNNFIDTLSQTMLEIAELSGRNLEVKNDLVQNSEEGVRSASQISVNVEGIRAQIEKLDQSIADVLKAAESIRLNTTVFRDSYEKQVQMVEQSTAAVTQMTASIESVAGITANKQATVKKLTQTAEVGNSKLQSTLGIIDEINKSVSSISEMAEIINNIASQTNLLSMNAAIEAAHAGDSGKGFAVVADEIGKLADSSQMNASNIAKAIQTVISNIQTAVESGNETDSAFREIDTEIQDVTSALTEISLSTDELNTGSKQIIESVSRLSDISARVQEESGTMLGSSTTVTESMGIVEKISQTVMASIAEIQTGISGIAESMGTMENSSDTLSSISDQLNKEILRFRISSPGQD